jgi:hypothetical protein
MKYTPENIVKLKPNEIFVFGSNLDGAHYGGAAKIAVERFGAIMYQGIGLQGQSYAFPTLDNYLQKVDKTFLEEQRDLFYKCAKENKDKTFYLTKIGLGIAQYSLEEIKPLFKKKLSNIIYPKEFYEIY